MASVVGHSHPSYCTGCGKVILSFQKEDGLEDILQKIEQQGIIKLASNTVKNSDELRKQLTDIHNAGYAITSDEFQEGVASIAAPIFNYKGEVIAAVAITGSSKSLCGDQHKYIYFKYCKSSKRNFEENRFFILLK